MPKGKAATERFGVAYDPVDSDFLQLIDFKLLAGRGFTKDRIADLVPENNEWLVPQPIIVNQTMVRAMGFDNEMDAPWVR
ncbi:MAG TPA: hypothetical protein DCM64_02830 [Gammaproteobacteria bacterium]|nr:hypothetical protein [Gammaproteobacteria bacterium]